MGRDVDEVEQVEQQQIAIPTTTRRTGRKVKGGWIDAIGMAEGGLLTDVAIIFDLAAIYVPILGAVFDPAVPAPFAILYLRRGPRVTLLAIVVATFLMTVLTGPHFGWRLGLRGLVGLFLGWAMNRRWGRIAVLAGSTLITTVIAYAAAFAVIFLTGLPIADIVSELRNASNALTWLISAGTRLLGIRQYWVAVLPYYTDALRLGLRYWPIMLFAYTAAAAFPSAVLYYIVANASARLLGHEVKPFPPQWFMWLLRMAHYIFVVPVVFVFRVIWFIITLPIRGPVWLWRLVRPKPSPFTPRAPRPPQPMQPPETGASAVQATQAAPTTIPLQPDAGPSPQRALVVPEEQRETVAASSPRTRAPQSASRQEEQR